RDLVARRRELLDEVHRRLVPTRGEPRQPLLPRVRIDLLVVGARKLHAMPVLEVGHDAPRRLAHEVALLRRYAELRRAFLELRRVAPVALCGRHELARDVDVSVVVDADFRHHVARLAVAHETIADLHCRCHRTPPRVDAGASCDIASRGARVVSIQSTTSRTAPDPPGRVVTKRAAARTSGSASATAIGSPTQRRQARSFTSFPT